MSSSTVQRIWVARGIQPHRVETFKLSRDPEFEEKHARWENGNRSEAGPAKFHFVKGFHRSLELFGQHVFRAGGVVIKLGDEVIAAIGVGGAPAAKDDEVCARAGIDKIRGRLK